MTRNPSATRKAVAWFFAATAALICGATSFGGKAQAALVTATITGTVYGGTDAGSNGGVFGPAPTTGVSLAGRNFTLVYTFDDTLGKQSSGPSRATPYYSSITGSGASSPGTAVLTIGDISVNVPNPASPQATNTSSAYRDVNAQLFNFSVSGTNGVVQASLGDNANILTKNYSWEASFSYVWTDGGNNNVSFSYSIVTDTSFAEASGTLTAQSITVVGPSSIAPPTAANETTSTNAGVPVSIDLTVGATGNPTSAAVVGTPIGGTVSINGTTATFTPTAGFSGAASFQFTLANAGGTSNTATATITVTAPLPAPPVAKDQTATTSADKSVKINLIAGATGNPTSAAVVGTPVGGTVSISGTTATFKPMAGFSGMASFQFTLSNLGGKSNTATVTITVQPPPKILFNGKDVSGTTPSAPQPVVVGQQIALTAQLPTAAIGQRWDIGGGPIGGYTPCDATPCYPVHKPIVANIGQLDPLGDITKPAITFYWTNATYQNQPYIMYSQPYKVMYSYNLSNGASGVLQAYFSVEAAPLSVMQVNYQPMKAPWIYHYHGEDPRLPGAPLLMSFGNANAGNPGITFTVPENTPDGVYMLVQLVQTDIIDYTYRLGIRPSPCTGTPGLDLTFPFSQPLDIPSVSISSHLFVVAILHSFVAQTYLMWESTRANSIPVPVGSTTWGFSESSHLDPNGTDGWATPTVRTIPLAPNGFTPSTTQYPLWNNLSIPPC